MNFKMLVPLHWIAVIPGNRVFIQFKYVPNVLRQHHIPILIQLIMAAFLLAQNSYYFLFTHQLYSWFLYYFVIHLRFLFFTSVPMVPPLSFLTLFLWLWVFANETKVHICTQSSKKYFQLGSLSPNSNTIQLFIKIFTNRS